MSDAEGDIYFDAISTGSTANESRSEQKTGIADSPEDKTENSDLECKNSEQRTSKKTGETNDFATALHTEDSQVSDFNGMTTVYQKTSGPIDLNIKPLDNNIKGAGKINTGQGRVSQLASQFQRQSSDGTRDTKLDPSTSDGSMGLQKIHKLNLPQLHLPKNKNVSGDKHERALIWKHTDDGDSSSSYSFAIPFPDEMPENSVSTEKQMLEGGSHTVNEGEHDEPASSFIDSVGYSHPNKNAGKELTVNESCNDSTSFISHEEELSQASHVPDFQRHSPVSLYTVSDPTDKSENVESMFENNFENIEEENIYDSVHNSLDNRNGPVSGDFEVINHTAISYPQRCSSTSPKKKSSHGRTAERKKMKQLAEDVTYEFKRKDAKKKSRALKRPSKTEKEGNPLTQHHCFDDPHNGALPEAEDEAVGHFNPFTHGDSDSSFFSDSTFDSNFDSDEDPEAYVWDKPLPPKPKKEHQLIDLAQKVLPGHQKKGNDEGHPVIEKVKLNRHRAPPALPENSGSITQNQVKVRGVLQSLIDSEKNYIASLERLTNVYQEPILAHIKKPEVKITFQKVEEIASIHKIFQIEFSEKLNKWNTDEKIGSIFYVFSQRMVIDIYSEYVNNYEAASELIRDMENSKQTFKEMLKKKQMESADRLSLPGLMLKPVQRFPQFIMIIKDLLKYSPRDHHDREQLQEAVTWIENVAHQLNERKRQSEQYYHGQQIMNKLTARMHPERNVYLIRQDDMEQLAQQDVTGSHNVKQRRLFLMNDRLVSVHVSQRDQDAVNSERFTYKWHQRLQDLELTTSAITPNMQTTVNIGNTSSTIMSPKSERSEEDPYDVASELTDMMHDITVLAKINHMVSTLKLSYPGLTEDNLHDVITKLQKQIQSKDYQLQMLNSSTIILQDKVRKKKYVFSASSANVKQEWCVDFLLAKYAQEIINIPSWHRQDGTDNAQPALLLKHMSVDMQRTFTRVSCGVKVYFPKKNEGSIEHLWICSSNEGHGQVSVVSLHTDKPSLIESFQATKCMILCVETVPGYARVKSKGAFEEDTVWMSTSDSEIEVFMLSERRPDLHRHSIYKFDLGCITISMRYIDDLMFCGNRNGKLIIFSRDDDGVWSESRRIILGLHPVTSLICVGDYMWAACGTNIYIIDIDTYEIQDKVEHQLTEKDEHAIHFEYLVKTGVGVWASFIGQPNICLYHSESKRLLQDFNICTAVHEFIKVYSGIEERKNFQVSCLMASLGLLWVGTNVGLILVYPLPRLRDGVPRINERPQVALHSHSGAVKFLIPMHYGPVSGAPIRRRMESVLKKYRVDDSVIRNLSNVDENETADSRPNSYLSLDAVAMASNNLYEEVDFQGYRKESDSQIYEEIPSKESTVKDQKVTHEVNDSVNQSPAEVPEQSDKIEEKVSDLIQSDEHKYFILEPHSKDSGKTGEKSSGAVIEDVKVTEGASVKTEPSDDVLLRAKNKNKNIYVRNKKHGDMDRKSMTLSYDASFHSRQTNVFHSELKNVLKHRKSLEDLTDRDATQDEVGNLYPTLLKPMTISNPAKSLQEGSFSSSLTDTRYEPKKEKDPHKDSIYFRPRMSIGIEAKKPDFSPPSKDSKKKEKKLSQSQKRDSPKGTKRSVSFNKDDTMENKRKSAVGTSFSQGSSVDTLRKQDTNTIMVISGGDGYKDWKKRQSLPNYRPEEPCLLFWMYRF